MVDAHTPLRAWLHPVATGGRPLSSFPGDRGTPDPRHRLARTRRQRRHDGSLSVRDHRSRPPIRDRAGPTEGDPTRRFPGVELRRYIQIRDRRCIMIGCRVPARPRDRCRPHPGRRPRGSHHPGQPWPLGLPLSFAPSPYWPRTSGGTDPEDEPGATPLALARTSNRHTHSPRRRLRSDAPGSQDVQLCQV